MKICKHVPLYTISENLFDRYDLILRNSWVMKSKNSLQEANLL